MGCGLKNLNIQCFFLVDYWQVIIGCDNILIMTLSRSREKEAQIIGYIAGMLRGLHLWHQDKLLGKDAPDDPPSPGPLCDFLNEYRTLLYWEDGTEQELLLRWQKLKQIAAEDTLEDFSRYFIDFVFYFNRVRDDVQIASMGGCPFSGIKNRQAAMLDIHREMERKSRVEQDFTLLLMRIDNLKDVEELAGPPQRRRYITDICAKIDARLRGFDNIYRMDRNEFLLCLKLTDGAGTNLFAQRMQNFFQLEKNSVKLGDYDITPTLSFCVAEPIVGDDLDVLLGAMRQQLAQTIEDSALVQYMERSKIEQFLEKAK